MIGCSVGWKSTVFFDKTRKEMAKQLDVMLLFKKIYALETAMKLILTKPQMRGLMLQHEMNVAEARSFRKMYSLKRDVAKLAKHKLEHRDHDGSDKAGGSCSNIADS